MKLRTLNNNVLIEVDKESTVTDEGLHLAHAETRETRTQSIGIKGTVVQVPTDKSIVKVGETVWVNKWEAHIVKHDRNYLCVKEENLLVVLDD